MDFSVAICICVLFSVCLLFVFFCFCVDAFPFLMPNHDYTLVSVDVSSCCSRACGLMLDLFVICLMLRATRVRLESGVFLIDGYNCSIVGGVQGSTNRQVGVGERCRLFPLRQVQQSFRRQTM